MAKLKIILNIFIEISKFIQLRSVNLYFSMTIPLLDGTKDSTLLIKNHINFPKFKIGRYTLSLFAISLTFQWDFINSFYICRNNIIRGLDKSYMRRCLYNSKTDPLCPIFKLKDIVKECGDDYTDVAFKVCWTQIFKEQF